METKETEMFVKLQTAIEKNYEIEESAANSIVFKKDEKYFAVVRNSEESGTVYQCFPQNGEYIFLPNSKEVKTLKAVNSFVATRAAR
jgi:hypothetical protein